MWEEGCVVDGNNIAGVVEGKLVVPCVWEGRSRGVGHDVERWNAVRTEQRSTATTSQPHGRESQGEAKEKASINQTSREICREADRAKWEQNWPCSPRKKEKRARVKHRSMDDKKDGWMKLPHP